MKQPADLLLLRNTEFKYCAVHSDLIGRRGLYAMALWWHPASSIRKNDQTLYLWKIPRLYWWGGLSINLRTWSIFLVPLTKFVHSVNRILLTKCRKPCGSLILHWMLCSNTNTQILYSNTNQYNQYFVLLFIQNTVLPKGEKGYYLKDVLGRVVRLSVVGISDIPGTCVDLL